MTLDDLILVLAFAVGVHVLARVVMALSNRGHHQPVIELREYLPILAIRKRR